jgi:CRP-like cAMP-binding protein
MNLKMLLVLVRNVSLKSFEKGEILIMAGSTKKDVFFIRKGLVRSYLVDDQGNETTFQIYSENHIFTNAHSVLFNEPSKFFFQALENTKVYFVDYNVFIKLTSQNPQYLALSRTYFGEKIIKQAFKRIEYFVFLTPEERYQKFVQENPQLLHRVPDKYIANVLGITPVSLSRIRNRISKKK